MFVLQTGKEVGEILKAIKLKLNIDSSIQESILEIVQSAVPGTYMYLIELSLSCRRLMMIIIIIF